MCGSSDTADESANSPSSYGRPVFTANFSSEDQWVAELLVYRP